MIFPTLALLLMQTLQAVHPQQADFDAALVASDCIKKIEVRMVPYLSAKLSEKNLNLVRMGSPKIDITYLERFRGYGGHLSLTLTYNATVETILSTRRKMSVVLPIDTTSKEDTVGYVFVKKGSAIKTLTRRVYAIPSPPRILELKEPEPSIARSDLFRDFYTCKKSAQPQDVPTADYPRCLDPAENCTDRDDD